jgi:hypothetical protein
MSNTGNLPKAQLFRRPIVGSSDLAGMANPPGATEPTLLGEMVMEALGSLRVASEITTASPGRGASASPWASWSPAR